MTRTELIDQVAVKTELPKKDAERFLDAAISSIQEALKKAEKVSIAGLGTFIVVDKKARTARNPKTGEAVQVAAKKAAKFKPGKELKEMLQ